jgi:hypothetical protein
MLSFASKHTIAVVLLQRNVDDQELLIVFFNKVLRDVEVKYEPLEKKSYALIKSLKAFRIYIL